jgi:hypothetical protein
MVDPQRDVIDDGKFSKALGQAAQFNGRQSNLSLSIWRVFLSQNRGPLLRNTRAAPSTATYLSLDQYKH